MQIGRKEIFWNYAATFLKIGASGLLIPFILRMMPTQMVGIWSIFMTISAFATLLDFGFGPSFTRNVTYVFSGVKSLKTNGFETVEETNLDIDYGLLKGVVSAMRWFYLRMATVLLLLLLTLGTYYIYILLRSYTGDQQEVYIAWTLLCIINTYNLFTLYYESLLLGKGLIKKSKQFVVIGQMVYLIIASTLIMSGFGLVAVVSAQASSVIVVRCLSYRSFFTREIRNKLHNAIPRSPQEVLKAISPNAVKIGLTFLGGFMVIRSATIIGSLYLPLDDIASYGITLQLIGVISGLGGIYTATYMPKIVQLRVVQNNPAIKKLYLKGQIILILTYLIGAIALLILGDWAIKIIRSQTQLMPKLLIFVSIVIAFLENNHSIAGSILLSKNEVPFFKASLLSGSATVLLLFLFLQFTNFGLWAMIIAPGLAQGVYQNWKWPLAVVKDIDIKRNDFIKWKNL